MRRFKALMMVAMVTAATLALGTATAFAGEGGAVVEKYGPCEGGEKA